MKKYKTWEAFKMLEENSELGLKFKTVTENWNVLILSVGEFGYYHITNIDGATKGASDNLHINNQEWALVKEPVDFMEAMKAFNNGKSIYSEFENYKSFYEHECYGGKLIDNAGASITSVEILEGKWYIQEDEE